MIEERATRRSQLHSARPANEQLGANLELQVTKLTAQRRLRRVEAFFSGHGEAAFLGNGNEVSKVSKFH